MALADNGFFGAIAGKKSFRQLNLQRLATAKDRLHVAKTACVSDARFLRV
ncbi:MAG TPA: hypothetical protein VK804_23230 [Bradyrhizobium sp.]|jgi:hypothetical protein|nr:hypothetical protein [Bradyrhizobium sp.]HTB03392.1 hypothetical protein [Bradyrhizobium sp.]